MKKILSAILAIAMMFSLVGCGGSDDEETTTESSTDIKVAMISDYGDITDQSFNQTTYEACKAWAEKNGVDFTYYKPTADSDDDRIQMVDKAVDEGYNVIVMPGYAFAAALDYGCQEYEDVTFVALDVSEGDVTGADADFDYANAANFYSAVYQEEIPGYMAGYAAVMMGYTDLGFLGGMAVPAVIRYGYGFVQGADAAAAELDIDVNIKYVYGNQFYGDADITAAMDTWYSQGTQVVFACGGGIYTSACEAAAKVEGGKVIGVDVDQNGLISANYGDDTMCITSAMKGLANTVTTMLDAILAGNFSEYAGKIDNLGMVSADPADNYVALAESTQWCDTFTEDDYAALNEAIFNGDVTISNDTTTEPTVTNATVDYQGNIK